MVQGRSVPHSRDGRSEHRVKDIVDVFKRTCNIGGELEHAITYSRTSVETIQRVRHWVDVWKTAEKCLMNADHRRSISNNEAFFVFVLAISIELMLLSEAQKAQGAFETLLRSCVTS